MSDSTPKPAQPTPNPADGGPAEAPGTPGPTAGAPAGTTGPTHPTSDPTSHPVDGETHPTRTDGYDGYDGGSTPPPYAGTPAGKKRRGLLVPIIAAALVLLLVVGGLAAFFLLRSDSHKIVTPASAGGMKRDTKTETQLKAQLTDAEKQFKAQDKLISTTASAIYTQDDTKRGPEGGLVFLGGTLKKADEKSAAKFLSTVRKQATANGFKVTNVSVGSGAKALCAAQAQGTQKIAICAWATDNTRGELLPTVSGWETPSLSKVMRSLRQDVEVSD